MSNEKLELIKEKARALFGRVKSVTNQWTGKAKSGLNKEEISGFFLKLQQALPKDMEGIQTFAYGALSKIKSKKWMKHGKLITVIICTYVTADLTALLLQDRIPDPPPPVAAYDSESDGHRGSENYDVITSRNLFSSRNIIPGENANRPDGPAIRTTLPFNLIGTLILHDELKSLATIEDKTATMVYPVRVGDEIPQKARIIKVEARRVTFQNIASGRNEYVDLPEEIMTSNPIVTIRPSGAAKKPGLGAQIEQVSENRYTVPRKEIDAALGDLNSILTQARAVPNWENGVFTCYKLFQIVPNSIFDKLGLKNGDCIKGVDGETIQDPSKAFEMLTTLKERNSLELKINRNGKDQNFNYNIN